MPKKWYVVFEGMVSGVYEEWDDCVKQVNGFKGNFYKGYKTKEEAEARYNNYLLGKEREMKGEERKMKGKKGEERKKNPKNTIIVVSMLFMVIAFLLYAIVV